MSLMSDERRKEMEEEMSRFELEISGPNESGAPARGLPIKEKRLKPPPPPPSVAAMIPPDVLIKGPPPPPPPMSPPLRAGGPALRPPPPPPVLQRPPGFIPPQVHRHPPPRPMMRPMGMRGPPLNHFPPPDPFGPPHMGPGHSMGGPPMGPMGPMFPVPPMMGGPMQPIGPMFPGGPMPMPLGNHPVPPGFCPQGQQIPPSDQHMFIPGVEENMAMQETPRVLESAPAMYAASFVKRQSEAIENYAPPISQEIKVLSFVPPVVQKVEKVPVIKVPEESVVVPMPVTVHYASQEEPAAVPKKKDKKKKIVRMAGGLAWEDNSLLDWENDDFRIFCGDLGNDVTDEVLIRAFSKYSSFVKAKVIRDKRTNKTKGFGFVSFKEPHDFIKAMREMNGKYVGSRPIKLRKSTWRDRNIDLVRKKQREKERLGLL